MGRSASSRSSRYAESPTREIQMQSRRIFKLRRACHAQCARVIAASPRCDSCVFARISKWTDISRKRNRREAAVSAKITCSRATGERRERDTRRECKMSWRYPRARARATPFLGNRFGSNSSFEKARAHGKERERRAGERRTFANPSRPSPRKGRVPRALHARDSMIRGSLQLAEHLPISGNMLGWSSSDLRLFSTRVGEERSLSLISRTAPRSLLSAHLGAYIAGTHARIHSMAHTAHDCR